MRRPAEITWPEIFKSWSVGTFSGPAVLEAPVRPVEVPVKYEEPGHYFYGYDWLSRAEYDQRRELIERDPAAFLYFTKATNKGTIHTLQMLTEAKDDEERAAVWIAAFAKEIRDSGDRAAWRYADQLGRASEAFLRERFSLWHHAMRQLVPAVFVNCTLQEGSVFSSVYGMIELARLNAALILREYVPVLYTSLPAGERLPDHTVRLSEKIAQTDTRTP